jgi:nitrogen fixation protein NifX
MHETGHLRVAITTDNLFQVDADFISARQVVFYDVTRDSSDFVDVVQFGGGVANAANTAAGEAPKGTGKNGGACCGGPGGADEGKTDRLTAVVDACAGSSVLFTLGLSDLQACKLRDVGVFPVKMEKSRNIADCIDNLQRMLSGNPPLWMVRALKNTGQERQLFANQEA